MNLNLINKHDIDSAFNEDVESNTPKVRLITSNRARKILPFPNGFTFSDCYGYGFASSPSLTTHEICFVGSEVMTVDVYVSRTIFSADGH